MWNYNNCPNNSLSQRKSVTSAKPYHNEKENDIFDNWNIDNFIRMLDVLLWRVHVYLSGTSNKPIYFRYGKIFVFSLVANYWRRHNICFRRDFSEKIIYSYCCVNHNREAAA